MIYVNGDSWTSGWPNEEIYGHREFSWPHLLSISLNETIINDARAGCSNDRIYRRTFDYILENKPERAIVCLTSWLRFEIGNSTNGKIIQKMPGIDASWYKENWHPYLLYSNFLRKIISLQFLSRGTNTKLFFLDTYTDNLNLNPTLSWFKELLKLSTAFDAMDDERIQKKFYKILTLTNKIDQDSFLSKKSYQEIIKGSLLDRGHPVHDGHEKIANFIYLTLKEK